MLRDGAGIFRPDAVAIVTARVEAGRRLWSRLLALVLAKWLRHVRLSGAA
jgi:hypothetical protein